MFPICPRCGCETMDQDCGGWAPAFRHDCLKSLYRELELEREAVKRTSARIALVRTQESGDGR